MTVKLPFQIEIPCRSHVCSIGHEELTPGADYYSSLYEDADGNLNRKDFCLTCWGTSAKDECLLVGKAYWKSTVPPKMQVDDPYQSRDEKALRLLHQALEKNLPDERTEMFVLGLYLARRKVLSFRRLQRQEDGILMAIYEVVDTEEMLSIPQVNLSQLQTEKLQQQLAQKLK